MITYVHSNSSLCLEAELHQGVSQLEGGSWQHVQHLHDGQANGDLLELGGREGEEGRGGKGRGGEGGYIRAMLTQTPMIP